MDGTLISGGKSRRLPPDHWLQAINDNEYQGVIFDCDGTLVESSESHFKAYQEAINAQGFDIDRNWYSQRTSLDRVSLLTLFAQVAGEEFDAGLAIEESIRAYQNHLHLIRPIKETSELLHALQGRLPIAVGTNAESEIARASLEAAGLAQIAGPIFSVSDGYLPKPASDIFLAAADRMSVLKTKVLVVEDSQHGVAAAQAVGMDVLLVSQIHRQ